MEPLITDCFSLSFLKIRFPRSRIHLVGQRREEETHETHVLGPADLCPGEDFRTNEILGGAREGSLGLFTGDDGESGQGEWTLQTSRNRAPVYTVRLCLHTHTHTRTCTQTYTHTHAHARAHTHQGCGFAEPGES